jgi:hypothetical protein
VFALLFILPKQQVVQTYGAELQALANDKVFIELSSLVEKKIFPIRG